MPTCEMCGTVEPSLTEVSIEGATLSVCDECTRFGENVDPSEDNETPEVKQTGTGYGVEPDNGSNEANTVHTGEPNEEPTEEQAAPFEPDVEELVFDYEERIQGAREQSGMTREELAEKLNEKESLIARLENGRSLPSEEVRRKLERELGIELTSTGGA